MGVKDLIQLDAIQQIIKKLEKENNWGYTFKIDFGTYETAIIFNEEVNVYRRPEPKENWTTIEYPESLICPDLSDYKNKILIEYEEEGRKKRSGAHLATKGHGPPGDMPTKRDSKRNLFYANNNFRFCRIWESQFDVMEPKLFHFLADCFCNRNTMKYSK